MEDRSAHERLERLAALQELKADSMARLSHDLRTPLTIISGFTATLIAHNQRLDAEQRLEMLERIDGAADRLEVLLDELVTVTALDAGVVAPNLAEVMLADVFDTIVADCTKVLGDRPPDPSTLTIDCPPGLRLVTDVRLLRPVVRVLVDNALDRGTVVTLRGYGDGTEGAVTVEVIDDGPVVPVDRRRHIFERSTQEPRATPPDRKVGLPLVPLLAGALGAGVEVDGDPAGSGAVFRVRLPPSSSP
jgi:two-component system sensor histidine kinase KdpD